MHGGYARARVRFRYRASRIGFQADVQRFGRLMGQSGGDKRRPQTSARSGVAFAARVMRFQQVGRLTLGPIEQDPGGAGDSLHGVFWNKWIGNFAD
jgi:hypothetical protein